MASFHKGMKFTRWVEKLPVLKELMAKGWTHERIGKHFGVTRLAVAGACHAYGIKSKAKRGKSRKRT